MSRWRRAMAQGCGIAVVLLCLLGARRRAVVPVSALNPHLTVNGSASAQFVTCDGNMTITATASPLSEAVGYVWSVYRNGVFLKDYHGTSVNLSVFAAVILGTYQVRIQAYDAAAKLLADEYSNTIHVIPGAGTMASCPPDEVGNVLHLVAVSTADGAPWHTIRFDSALTWQDFRNVAFVAGKIGKVVDIDATMVNGQLHVCVVTSDGNLWHTIRYGPNLGWQSFASVKIPAGVPDTGKGFFTRVAAAEVGSELHVCVLDQDGKVWHTIRHAHSWQFFGDVLAKTGPPSDGDSHFVDVACSSVGGELHVVLVNAKGNLHHTIRHDIGWQSLGNVRDVAGPPFLQGKITAAGAGTLNGELHVCVTTEDGRLYHTIRHTSTWQFFGDVMEKTGTPPNAFFVDVACDVSAGELHVAGTTKVGTLWHTIRHEFGWDAFGNVQITRAGNPGAFEAVSVAGYHVP
jgi:hypothetical protein